ncbi:alkane 1-monooxygenase [Sulfitobacter aestuariivivens]|uniref:Alkane 1-monooxygenase n=1 Tax=Sulfitobacter aestuariivivens TaxID=2766981 RepID=A0A927HGM6_9RHOB|nr:alkane 1-monooxygenase [Sulfitobacter aestuariivivens]MBD3665648.1 alkane 1-monooxygenase [Sulfitobacter aestuariivivens]
MSIQSTTPVPPGDLARFGRALPFYMSMLLIPLAWVSAFWGGLWVLLLVVMTWYLFSILDALAGLNLENADLSATEEDMFWYRVITVAWVPLQIVTVMGLVWYAPQAEHLGTWERIGLFVGLGVMSGTVGINYSHELMHQKNKLERWCADILLASVLYSHFRSEHLLVHHRYVGTPRDSVTARYNEGFHRYYPRAVIGSLVSAFRAEKAMLARKDLPWTDLGNPFWRYGAMQLVFVLAAVALGGWSGLGLFVLQAGVAVWQLELINYIEHYGLTRKHLGDGKYEAVQPRHSWNAAHKASNWLLINLQRHSDHHYKPDRRFPVLQTYGPDEAPQLPHSYPIMGMVAMIPPLWKRLMNPRVRRWRQMYYPEITDWKAYNKATTPMPR